MAWLERHVKTNIYSVCFRLPKPFDKQGKRFKESLKTTDLDHAERLRGRLEENIQLVQRGRLTMPIKDVVTFLLSDGRINGPIATPSELTLRELSSATLVRFPRVV